MAGTGIRQTGIRERDRRRDVRGQGDTSRLLAAPRGTPRALGKLTWRRAAVARQWGGKHAFG